MNTRDNTISVITNENITVNMFNEIYMDKLELLMMNPETTFIVHKSSIILLRFLHNRGYRKCIIYYEGNSPRWNRANFDTRGNFLTKEECIATMILDSDLIIDET